MAKPKNPLLSLDARGSVGGKLTYQSGITPQIVRAKPTPAYRRTLPQVYQRWLYEDYAYLWTQQSVTTKREYAAAGVRHHLTVFQYWMKYNLTHLPDITAWWKMDDNLSPQLADSSRNSNLAIVFGASPADGAIDGCLSFDGLNNYIEAPSTSTLQIEDNWTLECWLKSSYPTRGAIFWNYTGVRGLGFFLHTAGTINGWTYSSAIDNTPNINSVLKVTKNKWTHIAVRRIYGVNYQHFFDGVPDAPFNDTTVGSIATATPFRVGMRTAAIYPFPGLIDNPIIYNRSLDNTEILRHSQRRYPS